MLLARELEQVDQARSQNSDTRGPAPERQPSARISDSGRIFDALRPIWCVPMISAGACLLVCA